MSTQHTLRFYKEAAKILRTYKQFGVSIKSQIYNLKHFSKKALYALIIETHKHEAIIDNLLKSCPIEFEPTKKKYLKKKNDSLLRIMVTELLWGKKELLPESKLVSILLLNQEKLLNELSKQENQNLLGSIKKNFSLKVTIPRYVRVNTLHWSVEEAIEYFNFNGCELLSTGDNYESFLTTVKHLSDSQYVQDMHLKEVFIFPPQTEFFSDVKYLEGSLILQDKASCLAGHILNPEPGSTVLDMCAAPGMKTSHLSAIMRNEGCIYAVDRDKKRFETLNKIVNWHGATCVQTINADVLTISTEQCENVRYILCDPSCSGGGMMGRKEGANDHKDEFRLRKLANFQTQLLLHALRDFPSAEKVVYSTCSMEIQENEEVIREVLSKVKDFKLVDLRAKIPDWKNFGSSDYKCGKKCIYCRADEDLCNGFFVALFKRKSKKNKQITMENKDNEGDILNELEENSINDSCNFKKKKNKKKKF
nr:PREDICTED: probable 28S rRNA (cytosine-C(5))-methyltransferase [Bemisia tabaci]